MKTMQGPWIRCIAPRIPPAMTRAREMACSAAGPESGDRRRLLALLGGCTVWLAACGGQRPMPRGGHDSDDEFSRFVERGYVTDASGATDSHRDVWQRGDEEVAIDLLLPQGTGKSPLVIYLPGLGEPVEAGGAWRRAWAKGGYAVMSMQTVSSAAVWSTAAARSGDFAKLADGEFAPSALKKRIDRLVWTLENIARRAQEKTGPYQRIDTSRIAVAGFDLGAQTALALAGEKHPGLRDLPVIAGLCAVVAMSPQAILVRGGFAERFGSIYLPTMSVTATEDTDPYGLVDSPSTRQAPFKHMPPGEKLLLVLEDGSHQILSGNMPTRPNADDDRKQMPEAPGRSGRGGGRGGMGGPPGGMGGMAGPGGGGGPPDEATLRRFAAKGSMRQSVIVEHVSLAFLDATVKDDPVAREWLTRDAARWSDQLARLQMK